MVAPSTDTHFLSNSRSIAESNNSRSNHEFFFIKSQLRLSKCNQSDNKAPQLQAMKCEPFAHDENLNVNLNLCLFLLFQSRLYLHAATQNIHLNLLHCWLLADGRLHVRWDALVVGMQEFWCWLIATGKMQDLSLAVW